MKAVVIKLSKNKAVVLMSDGTFEYVLNKSYTIGQEIYIEQIGKTISFSRIKKYAAAAAAALFILIGGMSYAYTIPQSYISIDINPSIEFEINIFNHVINAEGVNEDGVQLLNKVSVENKPLGKAIQAIVSQLKTDGFIVSGGKSVVLGVQSDNENRQQKMMEIAKIQVEQSLESLHLSAQVAVNPVTEQTIENAHDAGTTGGKLELIEEYLEAYPDRLSFDELIEMPVSDIISQMNNEQYDDDNDENYHDSEDDSEYTDYEDEEYSDDEIDDEHHESDDDQSYQEPDEDEESDDDTPDSEEPTDDESDEPDDDEPDDEEDDEESSDDEDESDS